MPTKNTEKPKDGINEGTKIKAALQLRAIEFMKDYETEQTLDAYAQLLCWDLHTTFRTALDSYIMPMYRHKYFVYNGDDKYTFNNGKQNKQIKKGIIDKDTIEDKESPMEYMKRKQEEKAEKEKGEKKIE